MVDNYMRSKGYLQARHGEPRVEGIGPRRTGFPVLPLPSCRPLTRLYELLFRLWKVRSIDSVNLR
jgi:hypothetical protein